MLEVFVFPLPEMVFFPTAAQPLFVFEKRYLQMVHDSLKAGTPIALTFLDPSEPGGRRGRELVSGIGEPIVYERRPDGSMVVFVRGLARVRLGHVIRFRPYLACEATLLRDEARVSRDNVFYLERLRKILLAWLERSIPDAGHREAIVEQLEDPSILVETYASHRIHDTDLKQALLERDDINDRIRILSSYEAPDARQSATA